MKKWILFVFFGVTFLVSYKCRVFFYKTVAQAAECGDHFCDLSEDSGFCPIDCADKKESIVGFYAQSVRCPKVKLHRPISLFEARNTVMEIVAAKRRYRVLGRIHSANSSICGDQDVILTTDLRQIDGVEDFHGEQSVLFAAGVDFGQLGAYLHGYKKMLVGTPATGVQPISIAGALATGAHGSNTRGPANIAASVLELEILGSDGEFRRYSKHNTKPEIWKALRNNYGLLGFVSRVRLRIKDEVPMLYRFKRGSIEDLLAEGGYDKFVADCDYSFLNWFPFRGFVFQQCVSEASPTSEVDVNATMDYFSSQASPRYEKFFKRFLDAGSHDSAFECAAEFVHSTKVSYYQAVRTIKDGKISFPNEAFGLPYLLLNQEIKNSQIALGQIDFEFSIPKRYLREILQTMKKEIFEQQGRCTPLFGVIMRADEVSDNSLFDGASLRAGVALGEKMIHFEFPVYSPSYTMQDPVKYAAYLAPFYKFIYGIIAKYPMMRLHLGKNSDELITSAVYRQLLANELAILQQAVDSFDPTGLHASSYFSRLGIHWPKQGM